MKKYFLLSIMGIFGMSASYYYLQDTNKIDPLEWEHIVINSDRIESVARELIKNNHLKIADWIEIIPKNLEVTPREVVQYTLGFVAIDFCHWDQDPKDNKFRNFYAKDEDKIVRGSMAMTALIKKSYDQGFRIFDTNVMKKITLEDLKPYFTGMDAEGNPMQIPMLLERVQVLNEVGRILEEKWQGSFYNIFQASNRKSFNNKKGFVELLARDFPRFKDEYEYKNKKIKIYKLAQLSVMALQSLSNNIPNLPPFLDADKLSLCADYQIPRSLRAHGILVYGPLLSAHVDEEKIIPKGSLLEMEIRIATVFAGEQLKTSINTILIKENKPAITAQELDYALWSYGRSLPPITSKHHLTRTIMY